MKRILFIAISGLLLAVGCQRESQEAVHSGDTVTAHISVALPSAIVTKADISDGSGATELLFQAYTAEGAHIDGLDQKVTLSGLKADLNVRLIRGMGYRLVFWAQAPGKYAITEGTDGHPVVTIASTDLLKMMNTDAYDAFYACKDLDPQQQNFDISVSLTRPFAQLNMGVPESEITTVSTVYKLETLQTCFSVKGVPDTIDLLTGEVSGQTDVAYSYVNVPEDNITSGQKTYRRIAMVYVLAPDASTTHDTALSGKVEKKSDSKDTELERNIPNVPLKRNYRTNILGSFFSLNGTFNIEIDSDFGTPDTNVDLNPVQNPVTVPVPEAVDLGLPSGLKWASFNLGATKPDEYGDYYAWGETETYYSSLDPLTWKQGKENGYDWSSYQFGTSEDGPFSKYNATDNLTALETGPNGDDVASKVLGGSWRMPTKEEWQHLMNYCTWEWKTTADGYHCNGYLVSGNGNDIFLPAAGRFIGDKLTDSGRIGSYWTSTLADGSNHGGANQARVALEEMTFIFTYRIAGLSIRPVIPGP